MPIEFDSEYDQDQIDIGVTVGKETKTIEVRSSYSYAKDTERIYNEWFSLVGYYTTDNKSKENIKDFYITVIFRFDASEMPSKINSNSSISLQLAAGADRDFLYTNGNPDNLKTTMGYMELAYSIGLCIGPLIASIGFYLSGYALPFYFCGLLACLCIPFISNLRIAEEEYDEPNFLGILFNFVSRIFF